MSAKNIPKDYCNKIGFYKKKRMKLTKLIKIKLHKQIKLIQQIKLILNPMTNRMKQL